MMMMMIYKEWNSLEEDDFHQFFNNTN